MENNTNSNIQSFDEFKTPAVEDVTAVNEEVSSGFDYTVLKELCKVRNTAMAGYGGPNPSPRLEFIMNLLNTLGIEFELDTWPRTAPRTTSLEDFFGFDKNGIEDMLVSAPKEWTPDEMAEEHQILEDAFEWFKEDIDELKTMLRTAETANESKRKKRMLNTLIRIKSQQEEENESMHNYFNLYLKGSSDKMIMAHHDVANIRIDNCNDNSASVINAISCKLLMPELNVSITDGEENGGHGAKRAAEKINEGHFGPIEFVLNFELTALGGKEFFIEDFPSSRLQQRIVDLFPGIETHHTPFHDGVILRRYGIDSIVINPLPRKDIDDELDMSLLYYCHSPKDTISLANFDDMKDFCELVVTSIINNTTPPHVDEIIANNQARDDRREARRAERFARFGNNTVRAGRTTYIDDEFSGDLDDLDAADLDAAEEEFFRNVDSDQDANESTIPQGHKRFMPRLLPRKKINRKQNNVDSHTGNVIRDNDGNHGAE